jgi:hypothetical protein
LVQVFGLAELLRNIGLYMSLDMIGLISYKPVIIIDIHNKTASNLYMAVYPDAREASHFGLLYVIARR